MVVHKSKKKKKNHSLHFIAKCVFFIWKTATTRKCKLQFDHHVWKILLKRHSKGSHYFGSLCIVFVRVDLKHSFGKIFFWR